MEKCLYETLEVARDATTEEIKKQYRLLAVKYHPDKNLEENEKYTRLFQDMKAAYEILSDPNERAWYDSHREAILDGKSLDVDDEDFADPVDLTEYYSHAIFEDFSDSITGFYSVYEECFKDICDVENLANRKNVPIFGNSESDWEHVKTFYEFWKNLNSNRSFEFAEKYRLSEAPSRRIRRLMEKENKKLKRQARKKYMEQMNELVSFVYDLDPRVEVLKKKAKEEAEAKKKATEERRKKMAEDRAAELARRTADFVDYFDVDEDKEDELFEIWKSERSGGPAFSFTCDICNKKFKSESQWSNHQNSKKHLNKVKEMRDEVMLPEEKATLKRADGNIGTDGSNVHSFTIEGGREGVPSPAESSKAKKRKKKARKADVIFESGAALGGMRIADHVDDGKSDDKFFEPSPSIKEKKAKRRGKGKEKGKGRQKQADLSCKVCGAAFPTRNALFKHLNDADHHAFK